MWARGLSATTRRRLAQPCRAAWQSNMFQLPATCEARIRGSMVRCLLEVSRSPTRRSAFKPSLICADESFQACTESSVSRCVFILGLAQGQCVLKVSSQAGRSPSFGNFSQSTILQRPCTCRRTRNLASQDQHGPTLSHAFHGGASLLAAGLSPAMATVSSKVGISSGTITSQLQQGAVDSPFSSPCSLSSSLHMSHRPSKRHW